jgi:lipid A ethanolaminephosphotransferase
LRYFTNPTYWVYNLGKYIIDSNYKISEEVKPLGEDAKILDEDKQKRLVILVVGEAARADRFSLNGYERQTNPILSNYKDIINFSNMSSCGTTTSVSVPCMFSIYDRKSFSYENSVTNENILDVLSHTNKVKILWRDNNSDSKKVAIREDFEDFMTSKNNSICNPECRDEGMLIGLDKYIDKHKNKNIFIILHQMGNHGPAYYKRYTKDFEKFKPVCKTNQLEKCTKEEIGNAYDNAILYTDHFLGKTIDFLKGYSKTHKTAMLYFSDHGESLGEGGFYLHGLPYFMAPKNQTHIAALIWLGSMKKEINIRKLRAKKDDKLSHDNLFDSLLGLFKVKSEIYEKEQDIFHNE